MKKLLFLICIFSLFSLIFNLSEAKAEGVSLKLSPSLLQINAQAPSDINHAFVIENTGNNSIKLKLDLKQFSPDEANNGHLEFLDQNPNFGTITVKIFDKDLEVKEITLGPKQKKTLNLKILIPEKPQIEEQTQADYYFSILFTTIPKPISQGNKQESFTTINAAVSSNILLSVQYKDAFDLFVEKVTTGNIEELSVPSNIDSGPVTFTILARNTSPHFISPTGVILIKNMFGQAVGKVDVDSANILSNSSRYLKNAVWDEKFLFGFYSADLSLKLSDNGPIITKNVKFSVFPIKLIIEFAVVLIVLIVIYSRVKKKL